VISDEVMTGQESKQEQQEREGGKGGREAEDKYTQPQAHSRAEVGKAIRILTGPRPMNPLLTVSRWNNGRPHLRFL
jgi:hypothetical protein